MKLMHIMALAAMTLLAGPIPLNFSAFAPNQAHAASDDLLSHERWSNVTLSLRPPIGARVVEQSADDAVVRIVGRPPYTMTVFTRNSEKDVDLARVQQLALEQIALAQPSAVLLEQKDLPIGGRPGVMMYFKVMAEKNEPVVIAQSFALLDSMSVLMVQMETAHRDLAAVQPTYEAMVRSIEIQDPNVIAAERSAAVERFTRWFERVDARQWHQALVPQQWFRLLDGKTDVGYLFVEQRSGTAMEQPGLRVDVKARVQIGNQYYDSISTFFVSDDMSTEMWSIRTTIRPIGRELSAQEENQNSWAETGVRANGVITVTREGAEGKKEFKWDEPPVAYVPQVVLHLCGPMLPRDGETFGFYAYYPNSGKVGYRTEQVRTLPGGGFEVESKPMPEQPAQISQYDRHGKLIKRMLTSTRVLVPATPQEVKAHWRLQ